MMIKKYNLALIPISKSEEVIILANKFSNILPMHGDGPRSFDAEHLHINCLKKVSSTICAVYGSPEQWVKYRPTMIHAYPPALMADLLSINKKVQSDESTNLLAAIFVLNRLWLNPGKWREQCAHILDAKLPEVEALQSIQGKII